MNPIRKSFFTAAGVTVAALAVVYGSYVRQGVETGNADAPTLGEQASNNVIPEDDFYRGLLVLLRRYYVEPVTDEQKLAVGAVKGMVNGLKDPRSVFMDSNEFRAYNDATAGKYEGIGADLAFDMEIGKGHSGATDADGVDPADMSALAIPRLKVVAVTSGGPAEQAGVKPGDWVDSVEDHWVLNPAPVEAYRKAIDAASPEMLKGLPAPEAQKRLQAARAVAVDLKTKVDTMIMPLRAKDMLTIGDSGSLTIVWHRGDTLRKTTITKHISQVPVVESDGTVVTLRFASGASQKFKQAITGKGDITIDLRDNSNGDFDEMVKCLADVAPSGDYGSIHTEKAGKTHSFVVSDGNSKPPKMALLVDNSTRGAAAIFASALASKNFAKLVGKPSNDLSVIEVVNLPDGSGYTLATGEYQSRPTADASKRVALRTRKQPRAYAPREVDGSVVAMREVGGQS